MTTDTDTIEKEETEEGEFPAEAQLAFEAIDMLCRELQGKVDIDTMADALISVGFDMTRHIADHAMPGATHAEKTDAVREHLESIIKGLTENVWKELPQEKSE
tara:strand:+ start:575 stop:883 length:309 start_codon:yes stop_codon:yes gene_type:complete